MVIFTDFFKQLSFMFRSLFLSQYRFHIRMILTPSTFKIIPLLVLTLSSAICYQNINKVQIAFSVFPNSDMEYQMIQIELEIVQVDSSLQIAQEQVKEIEENIMKIVKNYCDEFIESDFDCMEKLVADNINFDAFYRKIKGKELFENFKLRQKFEVVILNEGNFGVLIDKLQEIGNLKVLDVSWKAYDDSENEQMLLEKGKEEAVSMCQGLGMEFHRISSVNLIQPTEEEPEPQPEEGQQEEQQEIPQEPEEIQKNQKGYHFQAQCKGIHISKDKDK